MPGRLRDSQKPIRCSLASFEPVIQQIVTTAERGHNLLYDGLVLLGRQWCQAMAKAGVRAQAG